MKEREKNYRLVYCGCSYKTLWLAMNGTIYNTKRGERKGEDVGFSLLLKGSKWNGFVYYESGGFVEES